MRRTHALAIIVSLVVALAIIVPGLAQSTTKNLSTNFTLVNLGSDVANGVIEYLQTDGSVWGGGTEPFTITDPGGQAIFRQYAGPGDPGNPNLTDGAGSVIISADQPVGAVAQILARGQDPTSSGAYSGFSAGDASFSIPLAARELNTASGTANSQIIVQNTGGDAVDVEIEMIASDGTSTYTKDGISVPAGASYYYDLAEESASNVPDGWYGSAVARAITVDGQVAVASNFFTGDAMQTFNAFASTSPGTTWFVPLFTSRLANSLSTPIAVQNLSGSAIPVDGVEVTCNPDPSLTGVDPFVMSNSTEIGDTAAYYFNPVVDTTIPEGFYGSCIVDASADVVSFVQMRFVDTGEAAAYEAIPGGGTDAQAIVPLVAKRLGNGFATAVTIQNLNTTITATVDLSYNPSPEYVTGGGSPDAIVSEDIEIGPGQSLIQNHRTTTGVSELVDGWYGTLVVDSDQPVAAFVQLTFLIDVNPGLPSGDNFMAHNAFTQP